MPKVFFLHMPKTGGSSVNEVFANEFGNDCYLEHIENLDPDEIDKALHKDNFFISGHIPYPRIKSKLDEVDSILKFVFVREPFSHLNSHISWIRNLLNDHERFQQHSSDVQNLSKFLNNIDFGSRRELTCFLKELPPYGIASFDNRQTRYLADPPDHAKVSKEDLNRALLNLEDFDFIGCFEKFSLDLQEFVKSRIGLNINQIPFRNKKNRKVLLDVHSVPDFKEILYPLVEHDLQLYEETVKARALDCNWSRFKTT